MGKKGEGKQNFNDVKRRYETPELKEDSKFQQLLCTICETKFHLNSLAICTDRELLNAVVLTWKAAPSPVHLVHLLLFLNLVTSYFADVRSRNSTYGPSFILVNESFN